MALVPIALDGPDRWNGGALVTAGTATLVCVPLILVLFALSGWLVRNGNRRVL